MRVIEKESYKGQNSGYAKYMFCDITKKDGLETISKWLANETYEYSCACGQQVVFNEITFAQQYVCMSNGKASGWLEVDFWFSPKKKDDDLKKVLQELVDEIQDFREQLVKKEKQEKRELRLRVGRKPRKSEVEITNEREIKERETNGYRFFSFDVEIKKGIRDGEEKLTRKIVNWFERKENELDNYMSICLYEIWECAKDKKAPLKVVVGCETKGKDDNEKVKEKATAIVEWLFGCLDRTKLPFLYFDNDHFLYNMKALKKPDIPDGKELKIGLLKYGYVESEGKYMWVEDD